VAIARLLNDILLTTGDGEGARVAAVGAGDSDRGFEVTIRLGRSVMGGFTFSFDVALQLKGSGRPSGMIAAIAMRMADPVCHSSPPLPRGKRTRCRLFAKIGMAFDASITTIEQKTLSDAARMVADP